MIATPVTPPGFSWQHGGAFVVNVGNVTQERLQLAARAGIRWVAPVLYNDTVSAPDNLRQLPAFKRRANALGINVVGWFNGTGGDPKTDALAVANITRFYGLAAVILDLEHAYQFPEGDPALMPKFVAEVRKLFPTGTKAIGVTTNGLNDSMIWNGRGVDNRSFRRHNVHVLPQWYNSPLYATDRWARADQSMEWLLHNGNTGNFTDYFYADKRGLLLSQVHGVLESSGMEGGAVLAGEIAEVRRAKAFGFSKGISLYTLENAPETDLELFRLAFDLRR